MTRVDFTGVGEYSVLPEDDYEAALTGFEVKQTKSKDSDYVSLEFTIKDHPEFSGRKVWQNHSLKPQALWAFKRSCVALGADSEELTGAIDIEELLGNLVGSEVRLTTENREYEGQERTSIKEIKAPAY